MAVAGTCEHCCTRIENLGVRLGRQVILEAVNLHVNCGEIIALVGPNGAGKTTLLRAILGEVPFTGQMHFQVSGSTRRIPKIGYVPQRLEVALDTPVSVLDFVASALGRRPVWLGISAKKVSRAREALAAFSSDHLMRRRIGELSGGELQRVLLSIAMAPVPELLLLDEPASGVDAQGLALFYQLVRGLRSRHDISVVIVTHDIAGIAGYVDRMALLNRTIIAQGTPKEILDDSTMIEAFGPGLWNISRML